MHFSQNTLFNFVHFVYCILLSLCAMINSQQTNHKTRKDGRAGKVNDMCKIIQFKVKETNGYKNLVALFEICDTVESCNFYLESVEQLFQNGNITEKEMYTLRRIGRQKRIKLATPDQEPQKAEKAGTYLYTPEMGQKEPEGCQMEASRSYYGGHYYIYTPLDIKGRGITFTDKCNSGRRSGWNCYRVTNKAYEKLESQYAISMECCLD